MIKDKQVNEKIEFYNLEQLSEKVGIAERTLRELISEGKLKGYKKNGRYFVLHNDFIDYLTSKDK